MLYVFITGCVHEPEASRQQLYYLMLGLARVDERKIKCIIFNSKKLKKRKPRSNARFSFKILSPMSILFAGTENISALSLH